MTAVFDSMLTPMAGAALARAARRLTGRDPDWVVNSHWHGDHIWGNVAFPNAHVVSTRRVQHLVATKSRAQFVASRREFRVELPAIDSPGSPYAPRERARLRGWFGGVLAAPASLRVVPPDRTFLRALTLRGARRSLELSSFGGGHSPSDVFGYLPDERILFAGDLAMVGLHPSVSDGWPDRWAGILRRMERLPLEHVVPGHGPTGGASTLPTNRRYLETLVRSAHRLRRGPRPVSAARSTPVPLAYARWGFSFMFPNNLARTVSLIGRPTARGRRARRAS